jgi:hypothetical protein
MTEQKKTHLFFLFLKTKKRIRKKVIKKKNKRGEKKESETR